MGAVLLVYITLLGYVCRSTSNQLNQRLTLANSQNHRVSNNQDPSFQIHQFQDSDSILLPTSSFIQDLHEPSPPDGNNTFPTIREKAQINKRFFPNNQLIPIKNTPTQISPVSRHIPEVNVNQAYPDGFHSKPKEPINIVQIQSFPPDKNGTVTRIFIQSPTSNQFIFPGNNIRVNKPHNQPDPSNGILLHNSHLSRTVSINSNLAQNLGIKEPIPINRIFVHSPNQNHDSRNKIDVHKSINQFLLKKNAVHGSDFNQQVQINNLLSERPPFDGQNNHVQNTNLNQRDPVNPIFNTGPNLAHHIQPSSDCQPSVFYQTQEYYSTLVLPSTVYVKDGPNIIHTEHHTHQVFTTVLSQFTSTEMVPYVQYRTVIVSTTVEHNQTWEVTQPAQTSYVTHTETVTSTLFNNSTTFETSTRVVTSVTIKNVVSMQLIPTNVTLTIYQTDTVTKTHQLPAQISMEHTTQNIIVFVTRQMNGHTLYNTSTVVRTTMTTSSINLPPTTLMLTSTVIKPVVTTIYSPVILTSTVTQLVTQTEHKYVISIDEQVKMITKLVKNTVSVPSQVVKIHYLQRVVPTTVSKSQTVAVQLLPKTQYVSITYTKLVTEQLQALTSTHYQTSTVMNLDYITSTIFKSLYHTAFVISTVYPQCSAGFIHAIPVAFNRTLRIRNINYSQDIESDSGTIPNSLPSNLYFTVVCLLLLQLVQII